MAPPMTIAEICILVSLPPTPRLRRIGQVQRHRQAPAGRRIRQPQSTPVAGGPPRLAGACKCRAAELLRSAADLYRGCTRSRAHAGVTVTNRRTCHCIPACESRVYRSVPRRSRELAVGSLGRGACLLHRNVLRRVASCVRHRLTHRSTRTFRKPELRPPQRAAGNFKSLGPSIAGESLERLLGLFNLQSKQEIERYCRSVVVCSEERVWRLDRTWIRSRWKWCRSGRTCSRPTRIRR